MTISLAESNERIRNRYTRRLKCLICIPPPELEIRFLDIVVPNLFPIDSDTHKSQESCAVARAGQTPHLETNSCIFLSLSLSLSLSPDSSGCSPWCRVPCLLTAAAWPKSEVAWPRPGPHTHQLIEAARKDNTNDRFSPKPFSPMIIVKAKPPLTSEKFVWYSVVIYGRRLFLRLKVKGRRDGRHLQSQHSASVTGQPAPPCLRYNYLDFLVTPVMVLWWGNIYIQTLNSAPSRVMFVDPRSECKHGERVELFRVNKWWRDCVRQWPHLPLIRPRSGQGTGSTSDGRSEQLQTRRLFQTRVMWTQSSGE